MRKIKNLKTKLGIFGIFVILSVATSTLVIAQNLSNDTLKCEWYRTWGGDYDDNGHGLVVDSSGNVYIVGVARLLGAGGSDMVIVKYDENGLQLWNRQWGGAEDEACFGVAIDSFRNVYLAGYTKSFGAGGYDMALVKYDENGVYQWNRTWGGPGVNGARDVVLDSSDNIYLVGSGVNMVLVKYDGNGVQQWNRSWGGAGDDTGNGVAVDSSGNIYIVGTTNSYGTGEDDIVLVKYDGNGEQQWNRTWGGSQYDWGYGVAVDSSSNVYIVGSTISFGAGNLDMALVKFDTNGMQHWNRTWGGYKIDYGYGVTVNSSGNVYIVGFKEVSHDMVLVEYDGNGVQQGNWFWGGIYSQEGRDVTTDLTSNIYIVGSTNSYGTGDDDMVLVKFGPDIQDNNSTSPPGIPSYNPFIIIGILSISSLFLLKKIIYKKSKDQ